MGEIEGEKRGTERGGGGGEREENQTYLYKGNLALCIDSDTIHNQFLYTIH